MPNLFLDLALSVFILFFQIILPGIALAILFARKTRWTLTDAFFSGIVWNLLLALVLTPLLNDSYLISLSTRILGLLLTVSAVLWVYKRRPESALDNFKSSIRQSLSWHHFFLASGVIIITSLFVATHNLGFDDVAHLKYTHEASTGTPYPSFRLLVGEWYAARYPLYGVFIGSLSQGVASSSLIIYYLLGLTIVTAFIIKVYEMILAGKQQKSVALATSFITAALLATVGLDNYFNYGIYPLQQAKLMFIIGLIYVIAGWGVLKHYFYYFIGAGLISLSILYHLNLILLYAVSVPAILLFLYIKKKHHKEWLALSFVLLSFPALAVPTALAPESGFLSYREEPDIPSTGDKPKVKPPKPSYWEKLLIKTQKMLNWVKDGRYKNKYIQRAFSWEVLLIPLLVVLLIRIGLQRRLGLAASIIAAFLIIQQLMMTVPQQLLSSTLRSGTAWMLWDLYRSMPLRQNAQNIASDPYTAFYLKLLGNKNIAAIDPEYSLLSFYPFFPETEKRFVPQKGSADTNYRLLMNGRYWGNQVIQQWNPQADDKLKAFANDIVHFNTVDNLVALKSGIKQGMGFIRDQFSSQLFIDEQAKAVSAKEYLSTIIQHLPDAPVTRYRDTVIFQLSELIAGEDLSFLITGSGSIDYFTSFSDGKYQPLPIDEQSTNEIEFEISENRGKTYFVFSLSQYGHLEGLGSIDSFEVRSSKREININDL
jgi:hypothetical protein